MTLGDRFLLTLLVVVLGTQLGCPAMILGGGALAGAGAVVYARGDVTVVEHVSLSDAWMATKWAMDDLAFPIVGRQHELDGKRLVARGTDQERIQVTLGKRGNGETEIRVRVGTFGDEDLSWLILHKIRQRL
jgi:hypothetical protein